jgi:trehalose/maltose hydrolase-like predicted phosphorylase
MTNALRLDLSVLAHSGSIFALANGHVGLRANLDEGEPHGLPGTYLNSFYEIRPQAPTPNWFWPELRRRKRVKYTPSVPPERRPTPKCTRPWA